MASSTQANNTTGISNERSSRQQTYARKGKRKISKSAEVEQSYKFKEDPLIERVALDIEEKR